MTDKDREKRNRFAFLRPISAYPPAVIDGVLAGVVRLFQRIVLLVEGLMLVALLEAVKDSTHSPVVAVMWVLAYSGLLFFVYAHFFWCVMRITHSVWGNKSGSNKSESRVVFWSWLVFFAVLMACSHVIQKAVTGVVAEFISIKLGIQ